MKTKISSTWMAARRFKEFSFLLLSSFCLVLVTFLDSPLWFINPPHFIDPWVYWGTGEVPGYASQYFGSTYYYRRWTVIAPLWLAQSALPAFEAQMVGRSLTLFVLLMSIGNLVIKLTRSNPAALVAMGLVATTDFLVRNVGMTYHQGPGLILFILAISCAMFSRDKRKVPLVLVSGILFGLLIITYSFSLTFIPAFILLIMTRTPLARPCPAGARERLLALLTLPLVWIFGLLFSVAFLDQVVARVLGTQWPQLLPYVWSMRSVTSDYMPAGSLAENLVASFSDPKLLIGAAVLITGTGLFILRRSRLSESRCLCWWIFLSALIVTYLLGPMYGNNGLWWPWTNVYLATSCVVGFALVWNSTIDEFILKRRKEAIAWILALFTIGLWALLDFGQTRSSLLSSEIPGHMFVAVVIGALVCGACMRLALRSSRNHRKLSGQVSTVAGTSLVLGVFVILSISFGGWYPAWSTPPFSTPAEGRAFIAGLSQEVRSLGTLATTSQRRIWILDLRTRSGWSPTLSAFYGGYSALGMGSPPVQLTCEAARAITATPNSTAVVLGASNIQDAKNAVLYQFIDCLPPRIIRHRLGEPTVEAFMFDLN